MDIDLPLARTAVRQLRDALPPLTSRADDPDRLIEELYEARLRRWERSNANREAAMARAALERRAAGDRPARMPVFASAWDQKPERPVVW